MERTIVLVIAIIAGPVILLAWSMIYPALCWSLVIPVLVAVILTAAARDPLRKRRQCIADCYFVEGSLLHRLLRSTKMITLSSFVVSAVLTTILLVGVPAWGFQILALLVLDSLLITLFYFTLFHAAAGALQVNEAFRYLFAKRWAIAVNVPLVVAALLFIQLQQPPPAYVDGSLNLEATLRAASDSIGSECPVVDQLIRLNREKDGFSWWLMLKGSASIGDSRIRWVAWLMFLLSGTLGLWAYSGLCVQLVYTAHRFKNGSMSDQQDPQPTGWLNPLILFWAVLWATIILLAMLEVYAHIHLAKLSLDSHGRVLVSEAFFEDWNQALPEVFNEMGLEFNGAGTEIKQVVSERIDAAFAPVYQQIPAFLDFHYTVVGEYTELTASFSDGIGTELERILFNEVRFNERLNDAIDTIQHDGDALLSSMLARVNDKLQQSLELDDSEMAVLSSVVTLSMDDAAKRFGGSDLLLKGAGAAVGTGAVTAAVMKTIGKKLTTKLAAKTAGKAAVKATGFGSGAASGAAAGLLCGPAAWICAPVAAVAVGTAFWVATDKVVIEVDEYFNREAFEAEIRSAIDQEKDRIKKQLAELYRKRLQQILEDNETKLEGITTRELIDGGA